MTQAEIIKAHIERHGSINSLEAIAHYGITRISAVIYTLNQQGYVIKHIEDPNLDKRYVTYAKDTAAIVRRKEALLVTQLDRYAEKLPARNNDLSAVAKKLSDLAVAFNLLALEQEV